MKSSFKSTLYTLIPILIIFGWLNSHMAYLPIEPNQTFEITAYFADGHASTASLSTIPELEILSNSTQEIKTGEKSDYAAWELRGEEGEYQVVVGYNNEDYETNFIISSENEYSEPEKKISNSKLKKIIVGYQKIYPLGGFNLFGWRPNWLWTYIIFSVVISIGLRKILKVY
jgi:uncharacterized membrane protein (DUF106 family)